MRCLAGLLFIALTLAAQTAPSHTLVIPPAAQASDHFDPIAATNAYLATIPPDKKASSDAYFEGGYWLILWDFLYTAVVYILLLQTKLSVRMRDIAERLTRFRPLQTFLYWLQFTLIVYLLGFPLTVYEGFFREHQYGLANQNFPSWMGDQLKGILLSAILGGLAIVALVAVVRRLPRTWPMWGAGLCILFAAVAILISPVFIAPLFNKYEILNDSKITDPILRLARANGIPVNKVYEVNASKQSKRVSANVSGFLGTERITLNDNLLARCSPEAVMAVMGHEMGHYVLNHIYKMLMFLVIVIVAIFAFLKYALDRSLATWGPQWELRGLTDVAALPLALLIASMFSFAFTPVMNNMIRTQEYESDMFGLNAARQPDGFAEAALLLGEYRKLDPGPLEEIIFFDHPSGRTRIYAAMRWKAEKNLR